MQVNNNKARAAHTDVDDNIDIGLLNLNKRRNLTVPQKQQNSNNVRTPSTHVAKYRLT